MMTLGFAICGFVGAVRLCSGARARAMRSGSSLQLSGRISRRPTIAGTSRDADRMLALFRQCRIVDD